MGKPLDELLSNLYKGNLEGLKEALAITPNVNDKDRMGSTILHRYIFFYDKIEIDSKAVITLMLQAGVDVNATENKRAEQRSALHIAALKGSSILCKLLLDSGAFIDAQDKYGNTPLWRAIMKYSGMKVSEREIMGDVIEVCIRRSSLDLR